MPNDSDRPEPAEQGGDRGAAKPDSEPEPQVGERPTAPASEQEAADGTAGSGDTPSAPDAEQGTDRGEAPTEQTAPPPADVPTSDSAEPATGGTESGADATQPGPGAPGFGAQPGQPPQPGSGPAYGPPGYGPHGYEQPGYGPSGYGAPGCSPPGYGAPGYGPPGYAPPGYGPPGYGPPGYGPPGYGPSGYGPPGYGPPGHDPSGYGAPGYGPPGYGQPGQPQGYGVPGYGPPGYGPGYGGYGGWPGAQAPRPGVVPLRPLSAGDLLAGAIGYIRANPLLTLGIAAVVMAVAQVIQLVVELAVPPFDPADLVAGRLSGLAFPMFAQLGNGLVATALGALVTGILLVVLSRAVLGQRIDPGAAWRAAAPRLLGLVGLSLLIGVIVGGTLFVVTFAALVAAGTGSGNAIGLAVLLMLAAVLVVIYLGVLWVLAPAAYVLEPIGVIAALGRSRELVRRAWWRTFGILLLTVVLIAVPGVVVVGLLGGFGIEGAPTMGESVGVAIGIVIVSTFAVPFATGVTGLLYVDQRIRRERFDVELARWAAGEQGH